MKSIVYLNLLENKQSQFIYKIVRNQVIKHNCRWEWRKIRQGDMILILKNEDLKTGFWNNRKLYLAKFKMFSKVICRRYQC